ncbi:MAG: oligoendopeptidase F [Clostridiales bacterium]|nr:oligoendopeptidase F [Clostridiales bacterium]
MKMTDVRADIPAKYKWDLTEIYADDAQFEADFSRAKAAISDYPKHEATIAQSAAGLYAALSDYTELMLLVGRLYIYAHLNSDTDKSDNKNLAIYGRAVNLLNEAQAATFFIVPSIIKIDDDKICGWYKEEPRLLSFARVIELARRRRPYTLSDECEKLLADISNSLDSHSRIQSIFEDADLRFGTIIDENGKKVRLTDATYVMYLMNKNRRVRRAAFKKLYETYDQFGNTFASLMDAYVREKVSLAKIRGYESSLHASVFEDEVTPEIYNNLIKTINENLDVLYSYYDLKREMLGLSALHLYDIYAPLVGSIDKEYTFEEATDITINALRILGDDYATTLEDGIKNGGWVDVFPNRGKRGGAYSSGTYGTKPYILLNYTSQFDDVFTLAHEAGHSMHSYYSHKNNEPQNSEYTIFVAEVASTVNELLLARKMLREAQSDDEKLYILNQIMETYKGTLYRQTMFAEFERDMHEMSAGGQPLTKELLCNKYYEIVKRYFGKRVVCDREIAFEWMRIPHFYMNFYVYKYATCISAASSIVKKIEERGEEYIAKYLKFLSLGGSMSPLDSLAVAEIDLTKPDVIKDAIDDFEAAIKQFREIAGSKQK